METADDGEAALAAVAAHAPDLILLDVMMPRLDGIETVKRLKADRGLPFIPVILLTAKSDTKDVVAGLSRMAGDGFVERRGRDLVVHDVAGLQSSIDGMRDN